MSNRIVVNKPHRAVGVREIEEYIAAIQSQPVDFLAAEYEIYAGRQYLRGRIRETIESKIASGEADPSWAIFL